jgi:heme exporter protein D
MNQPALELRDIHLPEPISWWPLAPGWWLLAAGIVLLIIIALIIRKVYQSRQIKRDIAAELKRIKQRYADTHSNVELARSLSILLRRVSITCYPGHDIAGMTGERWLHWLNQIHGNDKGNNTSFVSDTGRLLLSAPYIPDDAVIDFDAQALIQLCESWLLASHNKGTVKNGGTV